MTDFFTCFRPHVKVSAGVLVFFGQLFIGGEEDLRSIGGHANVVDGLSSGDLDDSRVINAQVEVDRGICESRAHLGPGSTAFAKRG